MKEFIRLAKKGCEDHDIAGRMKDCLRLVTETGTPIPKWLRKKIRLVHDDFDRVRLHAERNCRKICMDFHTLGIPFFRALCNQCDLVP